MWAKAGLAFAICLAPAWAFAQTAPTRPITDNSNAVATTAFVNNFASGSVIPVAAKCDGTTDDAAAINAAITKAAALGGGTIVLPGKVCAIGSTLAVTTNNIILRGAGMGNALHNTTLVGGGTQLKWIGSAGGTMWSIIAPNAGPALQGNGAQGISLNCANSAAFGLAIESHRVGFFNGVSAIECTTAGLNITTTGPLASTEPNDAQSNLFLNYNCWIKQSTGACIVLDGTAGIAGTGQQGNGSFQTFIATNIVYNNGNGITVKNADNNVFIDFRANGSGGSGIGAELTCNQTSHLSATSNVFLHYSAGSITARGTETCTIATTNNQFYHIDSANGTSAPTLGTGATASWQYDNGQIAGYGSLDLNVAATNNVELNRASDATTFGLLSLNGSTAAASAQGILGGGDNNTYLLGGSAALIGRVANNNRFTLTLTSLSPSFDRGGAGAISSGDATHRWTAVHTAQSIIYGASSGSVTFAVPAAAGSNTITWPAGTTDFSGTGGTSQVVKQTSAGGAFTVGQLAPSDLTSDVTTINGTACTLGSSCSVGSPITASVTGSNVAMNNTANYFDGPSVAQGTAGTWLATGTVTLQDTAGAATIECKLWDGSTVVASGQTRITAANEIRSVALSGFLATPAGNLRISCKDPTSTSGLILIAITDTTVKASTISAIRIQ